MQPQFDGNNRRFFMRLPDCWSRILRLIRYAIIKEIQD
jgi:hypothetical protein